MAPLAPNDTAAPLTSLADVIFKEELMKASASTNIFGIVALSLLMIFAVSMDARAQGRGRGNSNWDKKCSKFVNCHDARDGRWDGRGPNRRTGFTNIFRRDRRHHDSDRWERRRWRRHRDNDNHRNWRHRG